MVSFLFLLGNFRKLIEGSELPINYDYQIGYGLYKYTIAENIQGGGVYNTNHFSEWLVLFHEFSSDWCYKSHSHLKILEWLVL